MKQARVEEEEDMEARAEARAGVEEAQGVRKVQGEPVPGGGDSGSEGCA